MSATCKLAVAAAFVSLAIGLPAQAAGTKFLIHPITVQGSTIVHVRAINNNGAFVGAVEVNNDAVTFLQDGATFTWIYGHCMTGNQCIGNPTAVNKTDAVTGTLIAGAADGFVWQNGAFVAGDFFSIGDLVTPASGPFLNNKGEVAFNQFSPTSGNPQAFFGDPAAPQLLISPGLDSSAAMITGLNNHGAVAGVGLQEEGPVAIFVGKPGQLTYLSPPGGFSDYGASINDSGQVAGSSNQQGFVYSNGKYAQFSMPVLADDVVVQAINSTGRVIGTFVDENADVQRVFLYNGSTVSTFGAYPVGDTLYLSMNDRGIILLSHPNGEAIGTSYRVRCVGPGC
jgi:uncharacterized membrane protein